MGSTTYFKKEVVMTFNYFYVEIWGNWKDVSQDNERAVDPAHLNKGFGTEHSAGLLRSS